MARYLRSALFPLGVVGAAAAAASYYLREKRRIDFRGLTVLVSGGSRGLGLELARLFAREGASVILIARERDQLQNVAHEFKTRGGSVAALECDVRKPDEVKKTVAEVIERHGGIDVLVNNAGIIQVGPMEHMKRDDFVDAMDVHFWGPFHLMQEILPHMRRRGGRISCIK